MLLTPYRTALLLAKLFHQGDGSRARISDVTVRILSGGRQRLRAGFITQLQAQLAELGLAFLEVERGFAIVTLKALNGAPPLSAKKLMPGIVKAIREGRLADIDFDAIEAEVVPGDDDDAEVEEA